MTETRLVELTPQTTAVVREQVAMSDLRPFFDRVFGTVVQAVAAQGVRVTGPPFALYHGMPTDQVDVEAGFPVATPVRPSGEVVASSLPAGRAVEAVHLGSYETLPETYASVQARLAQEGLQPAADLWEAYLTDPGADPDPRTWRTLVVWPAR